MLRTWSLVPWALTVTWKGTTMPLLRSILPAIPPSTSYMGDSSACLLPGDGRQG